MIETAQDTFELEQLLALFQEHNPQSVLEIGVWHGGTLRHWLQGGRYVVAVDDQMLDRDAFRQWADQESSELTLIHGNSHSHATVAAVRKDAPFQFLFIDGDHTYDGVRADWDNYAPMVESGGVVAFHDIQPRTDYGVANLWAELKSGRRTVEIWGGTPSYCGIGVVWV